MANGVPCVVSKLLGEQLEISDGEEAMIATRARHFSDSILRLYEDLDLWQHVQRQAFDFIRRRNGPDVLQAALEDGIEMVCAARSSPDALPRRRRRNTAAVHDYRGASAGSVAEDLRCGTRTGPHADCHLAVFPMRLGFPDLMVDQLELVEMQPDRGRLPRTFPRGRVHEGYRPRRVLPALDLGYSGDTLVSTATQASGEDIRTFFSGTSPSLDEHE